MRAERREGVLSFMMEVDVCFVGGLVRIIQQLTSRKGEI